MIISLTDGDDHEGAGHTEGEGVALVLAHALNAAEQRQRLVYRRDFDCSIIKYISLSLSLTHTHSHTHTHNHSFPLSPKVGSDKGGEETAKVD